MWLKSFSISKAREENSGKYIKRNYRNFRRHVWVGRALAPEQEWVTSAVEKTFFHKEDEKNTYEKVSLQVFYLSFDTMCLPANSPGIALFLARISLGNSNINGFHLSTPPWCLASEHQGARWQDEKTARRDGVRCDEVMMARCYHYRCTNCNKKGNAFDVDDVAMRAMY